MMCVFSVFFRFSIFFTLGLLNTGLAEDDVNVVDEFRGEQGDVIYDPKAPVFKLPDIEVKGYGYKQKFQDTSGSVNVFTQDDISRTHSTTLNELIKNTPGFQTMAFTIVDYMIIRGTGSMYDLKGKSHAVFYNGIPLTTTESKNVILSDDIASVEVMKGPQHILYGSSARSGAISIYTKRINKTGGTLSFGMGNDNIRNFSWNQNVKVNDYFQFGFGLDKLHDGGFVHNLTTGQKKGGLDADIYRLKAQFQPTAKTYIDLYYSMYRVESKKPVLVALDEHLNPVLYHLATVDNEPKTILKGPSLDFWQERTDFGGVDKRRTRSFSTVIEHRFQPNLYLSYVYAQSKFKQISALDLDITDLKIFDLLGATKVSHNYTASSFYHDLRLTGEYDTLKWIAGISKTRDRNKRIAAGHPFGTKIRVMRMGDEVNGKAFYTQWKIMPIKYFDFVLGYRRQTDKVRPEFLPISDNVTINFLFDRYLEPFLLSNLKKEPLPSSYSSSANLWSGTVTAHITSDISIYATVSKGYVSGGYQSFITNNLVRPERGISREVGFKANIFDNRLFIVGAAYQNKYHDYQFFNFSKYSMENVPEFKSTGSEVAAYFIVTPNIILGATHSRVNPKIINYQMQDAFGFIEKGFYDSYSDLTTFRNKTIPWVPKSNSSVEVIINGNIKNTAVTWTNTMSRRGKMFVDFGNKVTLKPVSTYDSSIQFKKGKYEIVVWGKNLTNKKYYSNAFATALSLGTYARSRSFGLTVKTKF